MRREFVRLEDIELYSDSEKQCRGGFHYPDADGKFVAVSKKEHKTYKQHVDGINYCAELIRKGVKILPPLVQRKKDGSLRKLDGFKRLQAHMKAGSILVEVFVCEPEDMGKKLTYNGKKMTCRIGGMPAARFPKPVEYGESEHTQVKGGKIIFLYRSKTLRIEYRENIHVHWGPKGRNRLALGRRDFDLLAEMFDGCDI